MPCAGVVHQVGLAMHDLRRAHHLAAKGLTDGLVPKANPQQRQAGLGRGQRQRQADARLIGVARAG
jgi:hypothetical protein